MLNKFVGLLSTSLKISVASIFVGVVGELILKSLEIYWLGFMFFLLSQFAKFTTVVLMVSLLVCVMLTIIVRWCTHD